MCKITFFILLSFFSHSIFANSIYDNFDISDANNIYNEHKEGTESNNEYLHNYKGKELEEINPETYGGRDTTWKILSYNLKNLDKISYPNSKDLISKISSFDRYHTGLSFYGFSWLL